MINGVVEYGQMLSNSGGNVNSSQVPTGKSGEAIWIVTVPQDKNVTSIANISLTWSNRYSENFSLSGTRTYLIYCQGVDLVMQTVHILRYQKNGQVVRVMSLLISKNRVIEHFNEYKKIEFLKDISF